MRSGSASSAPPCGRGARTRTDGGRPATARLDAGLLVAVAQDAPDPDAVRDLIATAGAADRAVDAVVLGGATTSRGRLRTVTAVTGGFTLERLPAADDGRRRTGPFDVVGDVHGCLEELLLLVARLGCEVRLDALDRPDGASHPDGRTLVLLGDLVDRVPARPFLPAG